MKHQIRSSKVSSNSSVIALTQKSHQITNQTQNFFGAMPNEVKLLIIEKMKFMDKVNLRGACTSFRDLVDYTHKINRIKWCRTCHRDHRILVQHFICHDYNTPVLQKVIESSRKIESVQHRSPGNSIEFQNFMRTFYQHAKDHFDDHGLKTIFTMTMMDLLKRCSRDVFEVAETASAIHVRFIVNDFNIGILWAQKNISEFLFYQDYPNILMMLYTIMKKQQALDAGGDPGTVYTPLDFGNKLVGLIFKRTQRILSALQCVMSLECSEECRRAYQEFLVSGVMDWTCVDDMKVQVVFHSREAHKCKLLHFFMD